MSLAGLLAAGGILAMSPAPALAGGGGLGWSAPQQVLTLQGSTPLMWASNLVLDGSNQYWAYVDSSATPWLVTNAGGSWQNVNLGVQGLFHNGSTTPLGTIAVQTGVVYIPYLTSSGLFLDYNPSGSPSGPWVQVPVVPANSNASCGLGTETHNSSAAIAGGTIYVSFDDGAPCNVSGAGQVYVASIALSSLPQASGGSATWNTVNVTAATGNSVAPAMASNGQTISLAWDTNYGTLNFLSDISSGQPQTVFTPPSDFYNMIQMAAGGASGSGGYCPTVDRCFGGSSAGKVHVIALYAGGNSATAYAATDAGGNWVSAQLGTGNVNTSAGEDHPAAAVGSCGPAVAYNDNPTGNAYSGDTLYAATFAGGQWNPVAVGSAQNNPLQLPALAATANGFDLTYVNNDGQSPELYAASATCGPVVTSVSPSSGSASGGTQVTITGSGFTGATAVDFAENAATNVTVVSDTQITATSPADTSAASGATDTVDVTVTGPGGTSPTVPGDQFTYSPPGGGSAQGGGANSGSGNSGGGNAPTFTDLGGFSWAQAAINALAAQGIIKGTSSTTFDPSGQITRAQFSALMQRTFDLPQPSSPVAFTDVAASDWEYASVEALTPYMDYYQLPGGNAFHPNDPMDRQDVATAIVKLLAASNKLTVLSSADAQSVLAKVTDTADIAPALQVYVATAIKAGIMAGFPDGSFQPMTILTRAQVAVVIQRLQNDFLTTSGSGSGGSGGGQGTTQGLTAASITPNSGPAPGGTPVTITGSGFAQGDSVAFIPYQSGAAIQSATNVQVVSSSEITAFTPHGFANMVYRVDVCNATGSVCSNTSLDFTYGN